MSQNEKETEFTMPQNSEEDMSSMMEENMSTENSFEMMTQDDPPLPVTSLGLMIGNLDSSKDEESEEVVPIGEVRNIITPVVESPNVWVNPNPIPFLFKNGKRVSVSRATAIPKPKKVIGKKFRFAAISLFATFPQCHCSKEQALENILMKWEDQIEYAVVAEEQHQDGSPHLHCLIRFLQRVNYSSAEFADFIGGSHGNYQAARNIPATLRYVTKGGNYVVHGAAPPITPLAKSKNSVFNEIAEKLNTGATLASIKMEYPGAYLIHYSKIQTYHSFVQLERRLQMKKIWNGCQIPDPLVQRENNVLATWLNLYIKKPKPFKSPNLWICAPPDHHKTSTIRTLEEYLNVYWIPDSEDFYDTYQDDIYDLAVIDEFKGQKTITWLNKWLEGSTFPLRKKGAQITKMTNIPTIILSNFTIHQVFNKTDSNDVRKITSIEALMTRITEISYPDGKLVRVIPIDIIEAVEKEPEEEEI